MSHSDLYIADNSTENQNVMIIISRMGISEGYLSILLRKPLTEEMRQKVHWKH
nr:hypothetical protein [uncultured Acetobacterium sp.]